MDGGGETKNREAGKEAFSTNDTKREREREILPPPPPPLVLATIQRGEEVDGSAERINSIFYAFGSIPGSVAFARKSRYTSVYMYAYTRDAPYIYI